VVQSINNSINRLEIIQTYEDISLIEIFLSQLFQWNRANSCIRLITLESSVSNQGRNVFFKLCQVLDNVILCEMNSILIVHFLGNAQEEFTFLEHLHHGGDGSLNLLKHFLSVLSLNQISINLILEHHAFILQGLLQVQFFLI